MVEGVVFDMDGLMFDTEPIWTAAWEPVLASFGLRLIEGFPDACRGRAGKSLQAVFDRYYPGTDAAAVFQAEYEATLAAMANGVPKKPGIDELTAFLAERDVPMAVASSSAVEMIESHLGNAGLRERFATVVSGAGSAHPKPEPDIFLKAAEAMGVEPSRTLVLEDSLAGVRAGVAGGFVTVMVPDMVEPDDYAREHAARICADLFEVRDLLAAGELG